MCLLIFSSPSVAAASTDAAGDTSEIIEIDEVSPVPAPSVAPAVRQTQGPGDTIEDNRGLEEESIDQDLLQADQQYEPRDTPPVLRSG